jgi:hemolysin activation/secretion protein
LEIQTPLAQYGALQAGALGFIDYGQLRRNAVQPGELAKEAIASLGLGARLLLARQFTLALDVATVLHGTPGHPAGSGRVHLSLQAGF